MKYISIDIETTGLDHRRNDILQIAMVFEDTSLKLPLNKLPHKELFIEHELLKFQQGALQMHINTGLLDRYYEAEKIPKDEVTGEVMEWLEKLGYHYKDDAYLEIVVAGKNYNAFDKLFLQRIPDWTTFIKEHHRVIDPAVIYIDWEKDDVPPNLFTCLQRADPQYENFLDDVSHDALEDAFDIIKIIRSAQENQWYYARSQ